MMHRYDISKSYRWNFEHAPDPLSVEVPELEGDWSFAGLPATGPLGISAGPLLNGRWCVFYASLGFDVLTYKTVRSSARDCYPLPNLVHVSDDPRGDGGADLESTLEPTKSWAVSFGMPSMSPDQWRRDVEWTRKTLGNEKLLSVSVVGTVQPDWGIEELAEDYALCARWAVESGADAVEANLSCPNVQTCDGQLYQRPEASAMVAAAIRRQIGDSPLLLKVGHVVDHELASRLVESVAGLATGLAMTNSVPGRVSDANARWFFDGQRRGICGAATFAASCEQVALFSGIIRRLDSNLRLVGVGGAGSAAGVRRYVKEGAECVHMATAAMLNPEIGLNIRRDLARAED